MAAHSESDSSSLNTDEAVDDGNNFNVQNLNNGDGKTSDANGNDNQNANAVGDANVDQGDNNPNKDNDEESIRPTKMIQTTIKMNLRERKKRTKSSWKLLRPQTSPSTLTCMPGP